MYQRYKQALYKTFICAKDQKKILSFLFKKNKIISRMLPSTFLVKSIFRKRAMKINPRKAKATSPRILFFEIFAPQISKNILENLKIFPHKSFTFKLYATNIRKSKKCPKQTIKVYENSNRNFIFNIFSKKECKLYQGLHQTI